MGPVWELNAPWRLVAGRDYERSKFEGLAICHPWEAMQHAAGNAFAVPIPPAEVGSPMNGEFLLGLLKELVDIEPSLKWHFPLPQGFEWKDYLCLLDVVKRKLSIDFERMYLDGKPVTHHIIGFTYNISIYFVTY